MGYETNPSYDELLIELSQLRNSNQILRNLIATLDHCIHTGYDFNKDQLNITLQTGKVIRGEI